MLDRPDVSLGLRRTATAVVLVDRSCAACICCASGASLWCLRPESAGRDLAPAVPADRIGALGAALAGAAALVEAPEASTVLLVGREDGPLAVLARGLTGTR